MTRRGFGANLAGGVAKYAWASIAHPVHAAQ